LSLKNVNKGEKESARTCLENALDDQQLDALARIIIKSSYRDIEGLDLTPSQITAYQKVTQNCHCNFRQRLIHVRHKSVQVNWRVVGALRSVPIYEGDTEGPLGNRDGYTPLESLYPKRIQSSTFTPIPAYELSGLVAKDYSGPRVIDRTLRVLPIEPAGGFISYGSYGVAAHILRAQPTPTFGRVDLSFGVGCAGWFLAQSNDVYDRHIWVDVYGDIWTVDGRLKVEKLGYSEYIRPMMAACTNTHYFYPQMIIVYSKRNDAFFITNGILLP